MWLKIREAYAEPHKNLSDYWRAYGGWSALFFSPYLHLSLVGAVILAPLWHRASWWDTPISITPSLIGFTIGAYAILVAFGDENFRSKLAGKVENEDGEDSPYMMVSASLLHAILVQMLALFLAIGFKAYKLKTVALVLCWQAWPANFISLVLLFVNYLSFVLFCYGLLSVIAASFTIFRVASWYDRSQDKRPKNDE
mgnify:FL=1|tara:strand:- start:6461 stop:7051 length:591 start_codon:yes stop_codon:yes gene_type:complete